jgi:hypothetical protein
MKNLLLYTCLLYFGFAKAQVLYHRLPVEQDSTLHFFYDQSINNDGSKVWSGAVSYDGLGLTYSGHEGTDFSPDYRSSGIDSVEDWPVLASAGGWIVERVNNVANTPGEEDLEHPNGNMIRLYHGNGQRSVYIHMKHGSVTDKTVGQWVEAGEYLGRIGTSGESKIPHLHYAVQEYKYDTDSWLYIDPYDGYNRPNGGGATWNYSSGTTISTSNPSNPFKLTDGDTVKVIGLGDGRIIGRDGSCGSFERYHYDDDTGTVASGPIFCNGYLRWEVEWDSGGTDWVAGLWLRKTNTIGIDEIFLTRTTVRPKESFYIDYDITTAFFGSRFILGSSFYKDGSLVFWDGDNDKDVSLLLGDNSKRRSFTIPEGTPIGIYDGSFELWWDDNNDGVINGDDDIKLAEYFIPNILNVVGQAIGGTTFTGEPFLHIYDYEIDDDDGQESWGNNDGEASPGEVVEISLQVRNLGEEDANNVSVIIIDIDQSDINYSDTIDFGTINSKTTDTDSQDFDLDIPYDFSGNSCTLTLQITCDAGVFLDYITIPIVDLVDSDAPEIQSLSVSSGTTHAYGSTPNITVQTKDLSGTVSVELWKGIISPMGDVSWRIIETKVVNRSQQETTTFTLPSFNVGSYYIGTKAFDDQGNSNSLIVNTASSTNLSITPTASSTTPNITISYDTGAVISWPKEWSGFSMYSTTDFVTWDKIDTAEDTSTGSTWRYKVPDGELLIFKLKHP